MRAKYEWIRDGLLKRGYNQRDLAVAWGSQQASVSRFIRGEELQDLPISKAVKLASMLDLTLDDLAKGMGWRGPTVEPPVQSVEPAGMHEGEIRLDDVGIAGKMRLNMCKTLPITVITEILQKAV